MTPSRSCQQDYTAGPWTHMRFPGASSCFFAKPDPETRMLKQSVRLPVKLIEIAPQTHPISGPIPACAAKVAKGLGVRFDRQAADRRHRYSWKSDSLGSLLINRCGDPASYPRPFWGIPNLAGSRQLLRNATEAAMADAAIIPIRAASNSRSYRLRTRSHDQTDQDSANRA